MDSGNNSSGSLQSSSGGDDEYDSRAESSSLSAFLNNPPPPPPNHVVSLGPFTTSATHMFDPLSNYLDPTQRSPPALLNLDMMWSKPVRSEPNPTHLGGLVPCSSSSSPSPHNQQAFLSTQLLPGQTRTTSTSAFATLPPESSLLWGSAATTNNDQPHNTNTNNNSNVARNPRKRSRASRRAPTTVLTTDTTNFRAMVQEFTGIPAPPFTSSPFPRTRLDLFAPAATTRSTTTTLLDHPYLLRPFAQKLQQHHLLHPFPPPSSSSMVETLLASNNSTNSTTNNPTSINYQQLSSSSSSSADDHLGLLKHPPPNFNNMHNNNPILSFQNIFQAPPPKYPLANSSSSVLASKTQQQQPSLEIPPPSGADSHLKMGVLEQLGLRHAHVNNTNVSGLHHQNMVLSPSVGALSSGNTNLSTNASSTEWAQRTGTITNNNDCDHGGGGVLMRSLGGTVNYSNVSERVTNGKVHYSSASSSGFHGEKGPECTTVAAARNEGMVESWINCSSD